MVRMAGKRWSKARVALGVLALALVWFVAFPARRFLFPAHFDVVSIRAAPEYQDEARMQRAHAQPAVSSYASPPVFQPNGSVCGPTSLVNVFRSFGDAEATVDRVLAGSGRCWTGMCFGGLTLDELAEVARRRPGFRVTVLRDLALADLRAHLAKLADPTRRYIVNFDRGPLFGTQGGHHSPLGGYLEDEDLVLVLDVNEKYRPWLVRTERLFAAMDTVDPSSERKRGLLLVETE
jgi:hypothetical protein